MSRVGTAYFVSLARAYEYYASYDPYLAPELVRERVHQKIDGEEIHIGKPPASKGRIVGIDENGRYEVAL